MHTRTQEPRPEKNFLKMIIFPPPYFTNARVWYIIALSAAEKVQKSARFAADFVRKKHRKKQNVAITAF